MTRQRLDRRLRAQAPELSWARIRGAIVHGQVSVDGQIERDPGLVVPASATVVFDAARKRLRHARLELPRLYEDEAYLVVDKPAGLLTIATSADARHDEDTVLARAQRYATHLHGFGGYAGVLHRLDRDTSGALAVALSREAHRRGRELFGTHQFERHYLALVDGVPARTEGSIDAAVSRSYAGGRRRLVDDDDEGRPAITHYRVREAFERAALVELELETGRQHQIRLHMQRLGHPLVGERVYRSGAAGAQGATGARGAVRYTGATGAVRYTGAPSAIAPRQMLHAWRLAFRHPLQGVMVRVEAPLPEDFERVLRALRVRSSSRR